MRGKGMVKLARRTHGVFVRVIPELKKMGRVTEGTTLELRRKG